MKLVVNDGNVTMEFKLAETIVHIINEYGDTLWEEGKNDKMDLLSTYIDVTGRKEIKEVEKTSLGMAADLSVCIDADNETLENLGLENGECDN